MYNFVWLLIEWLRPFLHDVIFREIRRRKGARFLDFPWKC